ncbi:MAG: hypothetical protein ABIL09_06555 [Gemmatimonadota bacterium]
MLEFVARKMLQQDGADVSAHEYLGIALSMQGDTDAGFRWHERAIALQPENPVVWHDYAATMVNVAHGLEQAPDGAPLLDRAEEALYRALAADETYWHAYRSLVAIYLGRVRGGFCPPDDPGAMADRADGLAARYFDLYPALGLPVKLTLVRRKGDQVMRRETVVELLREEGQVIARSEELRIDASGDSLWEAHDEFLQIFDLLYDELVNTEEELAPGGKAYADLLRMSAG